MVALPVVSSAQAIRAFERAGSCVARTKGSHATLTQSGSRVILTVHQKKEVPRGTLRQLIGLAGMTGEEFVLNLRE